MVNTTGRRRSKNVEDRRGEKWDRKTTAFFKQDRNYDNFVELVGSTEADRRLVEMDKTLDKPTPLVKSPRTDVYKKIIKNAADGKLESPVSSKASRRRATKMVLKDGLKSLSRSVKADVSDAGDRLLNKASWSKTTKEMDEMEKRRSASRAAKRKPKK